MLVEVLLRRGAHPRTIDGLDPISRQNSVAGRK